MGDNFIIGNVPRDLASQYNGFPSSWDIYDQRSQLRLLKNIRKGSNLLLFVLPGAAAGAKTAVDYKVAEIFNNDINYMNGEIWNGNIEAIKAKSLAFNG